MQIPWLHIIKKTTYIKYNHNQLMSIKLSEIWGKGRAAVVSWMTLQFPLNLQMSSCPKKWMQQNATFMASKGQGKLVTRLGLRNRVARAALPPLLRILFAKRSQTDCPGSLTVFPYKFDKNSSKFASQADSLPSTLSEFIEMIWRVCGVRSLRSFLVTCWCWLVSGCSTPGALAIRQTSHRIVKYMLQKPLLPKAQILAPRYHKSSLWLHLALFACQLLHGLKGRPRDLCFPRTPTW